MESLTEYFKNITKNGGGIVSQKKDNVGFNRMWNKINGPICKFNNKGINLEKAGKIDRAIIEYEKCLQWMYDHFDNYYLNQIAWHSPDRLRILYKKVNDPKEIDFLSEFILFCKRNEIKYPDIYDRQLDKVKS